MNQEQIDTLWQDKALEIEGLCNLTHLNLNDLPYIGNRVLTTRQRDALVVDTTAQAMLKASLLNQVFISRNLR